MSNIYPIVTIGEVCSVGDGAHSKVKRQIAGIKYLTSKNIGFGHLKLDKFDYISLKDYEHLFSTNSRVVRRPCPGDVLIGIIGTFGNAYRYKSSDKFGVSSSIAILRPNQSILEPDFLYYVVTSNFFKVAHKAYKSGSVQAYTNIPTIKCLPIPLPPLPEQKAIASILSSLDDKIELNQQMNQTLEAIARAIFKSWFVDFDPVRAKMAGNQPVGMDAATANLFPDSFEESALGLIPKGWRVGTLSESCQSIYSGGTPSTKNLEYWNGKIPWLSSGETKSKFIDITDKKITSLGVEKSSTRLAKSGSIVIASAGQGNTRGQTSFLVIDSYINQSVIALRANPDIISELYLFFNLSRRYEEFRQISDSHSSRGSLTTKLLAPLDVLTPSTKLVSVFDYIVQPIINKICHNLSESRTLANIRDTLLPKLMSGEIRVKEAETIIKEVN
ncbi:MAG: restriction endonuclease subunit S [Trichodesmium sp. St5_bin8]|nr:restriction endonuclease subunit S [Trichodesmium sp. St5_bin8]